MPSSATINSSATQSETIFHMQQAFKLALSLLLFYWLALGMNWDEPQYGGLAIVLVSLGTRGATINKGLMRILGTTVGVAVGFLILGLFNHDRWATMLAFAAYIAVIGYFMQSSQNSYAWYVAAFVPLIVWGDNYPNFDKAFYFGMFRWLETTVGVLIYTTVDMLLWPRRAGDELNQQGRDLCDALREMFGNYRRQLSQGQLLEGAAQLRAKLSGTLSRTISTLQDAYADSPAVNEQKAIWEAWRVNMRTMVDAMEQWREYFDDCRGLDLERLLPELEQALDTVGKRLERIDILWEARISDVSEAKADDGSLVEALAMDYEHSVVADLSDLQHAAFMSFLQQLRILDRNSREQLRIMRVLAGLESGQWLQNTSHQREMFQTSRWDSGRFIRALFPPAAFIAAFFFWILINPPTGASVPMMAGVLALAILRTPMNPMPLMVVLIISIFVVVAPIYWLVMPELSTGFSLLTLIFIYAFIFGYLGGRRPVLKAGPMIMFVMMTGISNQQSYSFNGPVDGAQMVLLAGAILSMVYFFFNPMQSE